MAVVHEKQKAREAAKPAERPARAKVADEAEVSSASTLPTWRALVGHGPPPARAPSTVEPAPAPAPVAETVAPEPAHQILRRASGDAPKLPKLPASRGFELSEADRERFGQLLGHDFSGVRVHIGADADRAAREIAAHAFTVGRDIYFANARYAPGTPAGDRLLVHELTHVQQYDTGRVPHAADPRVSSPTEGVEREAYANEARIAGSEPADAEVPTRVHSTPPKVALRQEEEEDSWGWDVGQWIADNVGDAAEAAIPGYTMLTQVFGHDPIRGRPVQAAHDEILEALLTYGPFGEAVAPLLTAVDVLGDVFAYVTEQLRAHDLTFSRLERDLAGAWDEFAISLGVSGNVAIVRRYVDDFLDDVLAFVGAIVDRVIEIVLDVITTFVQPLLESEPVAPYWSLATKVFHYDPLNDVAVDTPTVDILAEFLTMIGQEGAVAQMEERGTLQETADWIDTQWATFTGILDDSTQLFSDAWDAVSPENLPGLLDTLPGLVERGLGLFQRILEFGVTLVTKVLELVKHSLLGMLSEYAAEIPGYHLITVILEQDPFTQEAVPRTAQNLIRGFISLLPGGNGMYEQLATSGVIGDAASRIERAMQTLGITWTFVQETFLGVWDTVTLESLLQPLETFAEIMNQFAEPIVRIFEFIAVVIEVVITLVLALMNFPSDLLANIINNAVQAIGTIQRDPVGFLQNMLEAVKAGFMSFLDNIGTHLLQGLADWLFGGLTELGIQIPTSLEPAAIFEFVLQVLGISAEMLWQKLGEHIGEERVAQIRAAIDVLTGAWAFLRDVQERGFAAIWDLIVDQLSSLWNTIISAATEWIMSTIVTQVTVRLVSMLDPTGVMAVINSFIVFFDTVRSFIEYLREILEIIDRYVTTLAEVAAGNIASGAAMLESGLAAAIPVALGFLANLLHLGDVPQRIREIIESVRETVDQALDWLFEQAMRVGGAALNALGLGGTGLDHALETPSTYEVNRESHSVYVDIEGERATVMLASEEAPAPTRFQELRNQGADPAKVTEAETLADRLDELATTVWSARSDPSRNTESEQQAVTQTREALKAKLLEIYTALGTSGNAEREARWQAFVAQEPFRVANRSTPVFKQPGATGAPFAQSSAQQWTRDEYVAAVSNVPGSEGQSADAIGRDLDDRSGAGSRAARGITKVGTTGSRGFALVPPSAPEVVESIGGLSTDLVAAVDGIGITEFLQAMAAGRAVGNITVQVFLNLWNAPVRPNENKEFIKQRFRAVNPASHEWLPTGMIEEVVRDANSADDVAVAEKAAGLVEYHTEARSPTWMVVFKPEHWSTVNVGGQNFTVPNGHVGAVYYNGTQKVAGQQAFHDDLRADYRNNSTAVAVTQAIRATADRWVWGGENPPSNAPLANVVEFRGPFTTVFDRPPRQGQLKRDLLRGLDNAARSVR